MVDIDLSFAAWPANSTIKLCNVKWNSDYRDVVYFPTQSALDNYIDNLAGLSYNNSTYLKINEPIRISEPFSEVQKYNYLRVSNPAQANNVYPNSAVTFYYFITGVEYIAPNVTQITVQLDVWSTYIRTMTFGSCYIERGHIGIANVNQMAQNGRKYLTVPEGLDLGGEYVNVNYNRHELMINNFIGYILATTISLQEPFGNNTDPRLSAAKGTVFANVPSGVEYYVFTSAADLSTFIRLMTGYPWIMQGIMSVTAIPKDYADELASTATNVTVPTAPNPIKLINNTSGSYSTLISAFPSSVNPDGWATGLRPDGYIDSHKVAAFNRLHKFKTYPYSFIEMTAYSGTPIVIKPELLGDSECKFAVRIQGNIPNPKIAAYPYDYNALGGSRTAPVNISGKPYYDNGEFYDMAVFVQNLPQIPMVNDSALLASAASAHTTAYQYASADWSQQRVQASSNLAYEQSTAAIRTGDRQLTVGLEANRHSADLSNEMSRRSNTVSGINSVVSGIAGGNPLGAISGAINAGAQHSMNVQRTNEQLAINTMAARQSHNIANQQARMVRDSNKDYADFASKGDYENAIAGINARVQDAKLIQPSVVGQAGGDLFNFVTSGIAIFHKVKTLEPNAYNMIGDFWLRYGYAINRFATIPSNFQVMTKFTYWKLKETYIDAANCPETFKQTIRGIFEKGVTVWNNPNDLGTMPLYTNEPLAGVTL